MTNEQLKGLFAPGAEADSNIFAKLIDSFRNNSEMIPAIDVNGISEIVNSGFTGEAKPDVAGVAQTIPVNSDVFQMWYVSDSGNYSGFDAADGSGPVVVSAADVENKLAFIVGSEGAFTVKTVDFNESFNSSIEKVEKSFKSLTFSDESVDVTDIAQCPTNAIGLTVNMNNFNSNGVVTIENDTINKNGGVAIDLNTDTKRVSFSVTANSAVFWILFGKTSDGQYLIHAISPGVASFQIAKIAMSSVGDATMTGIVVTAAEGSNLSAGDKAITYNADGSLTYINNNVNVFTLSPEDLAHLDYASPAVGLLVGVTSLIATGTFTLLSAQNLYNVETVRMENKEFDHVVTYDPATQKIGYSSSLTPNNLPFAAKKITLLGDSITVDPAYAGFYYSVAVQTGTSAATVTRRGISGQCWGGQLQSDSVINSVISDLPDVVVLHSVNDHRSNIPLGTIAAQAGEASTAGGIKKILDAIINSNKYVQIVMCTSLPYAPYTVAPYNIVGSNQLNDLGLSKKNYDDLFIEIARAYGLHICDLAALIPIRPQIESSAERYLTYEGVHPLPAAATWMGKEVSKVINAINN